MRVISGIYKGRKLKAPSGHNTRPLTDRIKEALFNIIGANMPESRFLDLFAGSGSVGIEALSRQAAQVVFIDHHPGAITTIYENLANCKIKTGYEVYRNDVFKALAIMAGRGLVFDFIYVDPPFSNVRLFAATIQALDEQVSLLSNRGIIILRIPHKHVLSVNLQNLEQFRADTYGESTLIYFKHRDREEIKNGDIRNT